MIDIEQAHEEWVLMEEPMGSFQAFIFAEYQKTLAEVKRSRGLIKNSLNYIECIPRTSDTVKLKFLIDDLRRYVLREGDEEE